MSTARKLPVMSCSRRTVLELLGAAAIGGLALVGCADNGADLPTAATTTCGSDVCIDLTAAANATLTQVGGTMMFDSASDKILVARISATEVIALSAVCTHAGCIVDYNASAQRIDCGCHGSEFSLDGAVLHGPAARPLTAYSATLANDTITVVAQAS